MTNVSEKVLIVDDEPATRNVCHRALLGLGLGVETAQSAGEALEMVRSKTYDFVLTDVCMPGSVTELVETIKERSPATDVVIMTGSPELGSAVSTLKGGACDYLIKPLNLRQLRSIAARSIEKRRLSDDLDREKNLRRELEAAYAELQKVERLKDGLVARVNHELRTPMMIALAALEGLAEAITSDYGRRMRELLGGALNRLQKIIESLLLFSDLSGHGLELRKTQVDLRLLLEAAIRRYRPLIEEKELAVDLSLEEEPLRLTADPQHMATVIKHLLLNAIQFNKKGGRIRIRAWRGGSPDVPTGGAAAPTCRRSMGLQEGRPVNGAMGTSAWGGAEELGFSIADTGIGIGPAEISRIFDGFYQVADYLTRSVGGLGLGLAIVRRIVEAHGGAVGARSSEGKGSEFTVRLPAPGVSGAGVPPRLKTGSGLPVKP